MTGLVLVSVTACTTSTYKNGVEIETPKARAQVEPVSKEAPKLHEEKNYSNLNYGLLAPLIGEWQVRDSQLQQDGSWQAQAGASWKFYPIQGGISLEDEWISNVDSADKLPGFGTHLRVFDPMSKEWQAAWLSSRARTLEMYRGAETESEVLFTSRPNAIGRMTRTVFSNIRPDSFNWHMSWSIDGGETWLMIYKVDATRKL